MQIKSQMQYFKILYDEEKYFKNVTLTDLWFSSTSLVNCQLFLETVKCILYLICDLLYFCGFKHVPIYAHTNYYIYFAKAFTVVQSWVRTFLKINFSSLHRCFCPELLFQV